MRWERRGRFEPIRTSLRAKVSLGVLLPLLLILGGVAAIQVAQHERAVLNSTALIAANAGHVVEEALRHEIVESHFDDPQSLLDAVTASGGFRIVYLLDTDGNVLFAPGGIGQGTQLSNDEPNCALCHQLEEEERPESVVVTTEDGERVFRSMIPMENTAQCAECHEEEGPLALLMTDTSMTALESTLTADFRQNLAWLAIAVAVSVLVVNVSLNRLVVDRLKRLTRAMSVFGVGHHKSQLTDEGGDEIGQLVEAFNEMGRRAEMEAAENQLLSEDLRSQSALRGQLLDRLITAQEDERKRLAREIHDELGQAMGGLALQAEVLRKLIPPGAEPAEAQLAQIKALINSTTDSMYDMILALRPSALDDLGLVAALRAHAERVLENTGIKFSLDAAEFDGHLPPEKEIAVYRMFQEALTNAVRHASPKNIRFRLARKGQWFEGSIEDDGRGFNPDDIHSGGTEPRGLGLLGMKERVAQFGGELVIESQYGGGTRLHIGLPLPEDETI